MKNFVLMTDETISLRTKGEIEKIIELYKEKYPERELPYQVFDLGSKMDLRQFIPKSAVVGDLVRFPTGLVARIVPDDEAELYIDSDKIGITDVAFYLENDGCFLVAKEDYQKHDGTIRMEIPTMNLPGCLNYGYYAVCNENPAWKVFYSKVGLYQTGDLGESVVFDKKMYVGNTWSLRLNPEQPIRHV